MPQTKALIIYSPNQARWRTVVIPDDDEQIGIHTKNILPGEECLICDCEEVKKVGPWSILERHLGRPQEDDRCHIVDENDNIIIPHICADPLIDKHPLGRIKKVDTGF